MLLHKPQHCAAAHAETGRNFVEGIEGYGHVSFRQCDLAVSRAGDTAVSLGAQPFANCRLGHGPALLGFRHIAAHR